MSVPANLAAEFTAAGHANHIPPEVLAGLAQVESAMGANRGPSSAGAVGLMQFMPGTASGLGVDPRNDRQAIWGAAKLLNQYGYQDNPDLALRRYNAGPKGPVNSAPVIRYAQNVRAAGHQLASQLAGASTRDASPTSPTSSGTPPTSSSAPTSVASVFLTVVLTAAGGVLAFVGARRALEPA